MCKYVTFSDGETERAKDAKFDIKEYWDKIGIFIISLIRKEWEEIINTTNS